MVILYQKLSSYELIVIKFKCFYEFGNKTGKKLGKM